MKRRNTGKSIIFLNVLMLFVLWSNSTIDAAPFAYVPNSGNNNVSVIDTATDPPSVVTTVSAGTNPRGVAIVVKASETLALITNYNSDDVSVIRTYNDAIINNVVFEKVRDIRVGRNPYGITVDPSGTFAYVTNYTDGTVSKIDLGSYIVTATIPVGVNPIGVIVSPDGSKIYAVNNASDSVSVIDAADNTSIMTVAVGLRPFGAAVNAAGTFVYVANSGGNSISVIKTADNSVITKSDFHLSTPYGVAVNPAGTIVYITNYSSGTVSLFDANSNTFSVPNIGVGINPVGVSFNLDGKFTYVVSAFDGTVCVIDNSMNTEKLPRIKVGAIPYALGSFVAPFGNTVPTVISTIPANAVQDISRSTTIQAAFSDIMDATTINSSTFLVSGGVKGTVTYDSVGKIATFKTSDDLSKNTTYTVTLTTGIKNAMGNALASNYTWSFTTSEKTDGSCFIATAVYGSHDDIHVRILRTFRDQYLLPNTVGAAMVDVYYKYSPPMADFIREHNVLRTPTKWLLTPLVYFVQYPSHLMFILALGLIIIAGRIKVRK